MIALWLIDFSIILGTVNRNCKTCRDKLISIMPSLGLDTKEVEMYSILLIDRLRISDLQKRLQVSERTARRYVKTMLDNGFIKRKVVEGKRLAYEYMSLPPASVWRNLKNNIVMV